MCITNYYCQTLHKLLNNSTADELHGCQGPQEKDGRNAEGMQCEPANGEDWVNAGSTGGR